MKIQIVWAGRTRNPSWRQLQQEYTSRISHYATLRIDEVREAGRRDHDRNQAAILSVESDRIRARIVPGSVLVVLDERGKSWTTGQFKDWLCTRQNEGVQHVSFVAGGFLGLDPALVERANLVMALSAMTLPHEMVRVLLLEQLYRAFTLIHRHPYHKS